jgi:hypothetical protein
LRWEYYGRNEKINFQSLEFLSFLEREKKLLLFPSGMVLLGSRKLGRFKAGAAGARHLETRQLSELRQTRNVPARRPRVYCKTRRSAVSFSGLSLRFHRCDPQPGH